MLRWLIPLAFAALVAASGYAGFLAWPPGGRESVALAAPGTMLGEKQPSPSPFEPPLVDIARTASGTFFGVKDELLLAPLRKGEVTDARLNRGGSSISFRLTFADGSRAAFKPNQTNLQTVPRKEIAAYRLNRLLGLNGVPPATGRTLHRDELLAHLEPLPPPLLQRVQKETIFDDEGFTRGAVSFWIPVVVDSKLDTAEAIEQWTGWLGVGHDIPDDHVSMMEQLSSLVLFDFLENNSDRFSGGNLLMSPDGRTLYYMDNTFAFFPQPEGHEKCREALFRVQKFSRRLVGAVRRLTLHSLVQALSAEPGVLTDDEMTALMARRDVALGYIDSLIGRYGADRVLVFP